MKAYNTPKDELHIESDTGETLVSITPEKTTIANLEGGGGVYVIKIVWNSEAELYETTETVAEIVAKAETATMIFAQTEGDLNERYNYIVTYIDSTMLSVFGPDFDDPDTAPLKTSNFLSGGSQYPYELNTNEDT